MLLIARIAPQPRKLAIESLGNASAFPMSPVEKILLAREFRVGEWFLDGVTRLIRHAQQPPMETLIRELGLTTACKIIDLQPKLSLQGLCAPGSSVTTGRMLFPLETLRCGRCVNLLIQQAHVICASVGCGSIHGDPNGSTKAYVLLHDSKLTLMDTSLGLQMQTAKVGCMGCGHPVFHPDGFNCQACGENMNRSLPVYLGYRDRDLHAMIKEQFKDEMDFRDDD